MIIKIPTVVLFIGLIGGAHLAIAGEQEPFSTPWTHREFTDRFTGRYSCHAEWTSFTLINQGDNLLFQLPARAARAIQEGALTAARDCLHQEQMRLSISRRRNDPPYMCSFNRAQFRMEFFFGAEGSRSENSLRVSDEELRSGNIWASFGLPSADTLTSDTTLLEYRILMLDSYTVNYSVRSREIWRGSVALIDLLGGRRVALECAQREELTRGTPSAGDSADASNASNAIPVIDPQSTPLPEETKNATDDGETELQTRISAEDIAVERQLSRFSQFLFIGFSGTPSDRRAVVLMPGGVVERFRIGETHHGVRVLDFDDLELRLEFGSEEILLTRVDCDERDDC